MATATEDSGPNCDCGRPQSIAIRTIQRTHDRRYEYCRCECGREWTLTTLVNDLTEPITSDEVMEVHRLFSQPDKPLSEITGT